MVINLWGDAVAKNISEVARSYYEAMAAKDEKTIESFLHPSVSFLNPVAEFKGKTDVQSFVKGFLPNFETLTIRSVCANINQAMLAYDIKFPNSASVVRGASLLDFNDGLISRIELFFDTGKA